jgi:hypothetical protein
MRGQYVPALALMLIAGCGDGQPAAEPQPSRWATVAPATPSARATGVPPRDVATAPATSSAPVLRRAAPPSDPTDAFTGKDVVVGLVTRGGPGPCFGVRTDDGTQYALYSGSPLTLTRGQYIRLRTQPSTLRIDCGPGRFRAITAVEPVS